MRTENGMLMEQRTDNAELCPVVVDLDGTLIHTDMLYESALRTLCTNPLDLLRAPLLLHRGKAVLKQHLSRNFQFNAGTLPYNTELITWLKLQKAQGRKIVLCTASDHSIAQAVADHLNIFDEVIASDGEQNLSGTRKAEELERRFGPGAFDYAGNAKVDVAVWRRSRKAIVVNASDLLTAEAGEAFEVDQVFPRKRPELSVWRRVLRAHQWLKNLLLFMPVVAAHQFTDANTWPMLLLAFLSFCLCASSVYIANDLIDLESDRLHVRKRTRPFAAGQVPIWVGVLLAPLLFLGALGLGAFVGKIFLAWLATYFAITCAYSLGLKRVILIDCLILAILYTVRIIAGAAAIKISLSFWLLAFSVFLFLSLAFVKRYAELEIQLLKGKKRIHGRGYYTSDAQVIQTFGITSGYLSVLVLALYLNSDIVTRLYRFPEMIWAAIPIMLFWISWIWMQAHRGKMHDDPVIFAVKDRASLVAGALFTIVFFLGTVGLPW